MNAAELAITLPVGVILIALGWMLWKKRKIGWMHAYHIKNVQSQDVGAYTRLWGIALIVLGVCVCVTGVVDFVWRTALGWIASGVGLAVCLTLGERAQKKYNGAWFS